MSPLRLRRWWRGLPAETRIKWIASVLLIFAGTEVLVLAPFVFDVAALIDAFGFLFVLSAGGAAVRQSLSRLWWHIRGGARGVLAAFRGVDAVADFGSRLSGKWQQRYLAVDVFAARLVLGLCVLFFGALAFHGLVSTYDVISQSRVILQTRDGDAVHAFDVAVTAQTKSEVIWT